MDIIKKVKPIKATYEKLSRFHKLWIMLILVSLFNFIFPGHGMAFTYQKPKFETGMIFELGSHFDYIEQLRLMAMQTYQKQKLQQELEKQARLAIKLKSYLSARNSPLADYSSVLIKQNNWKKIIALSNAESSMCRRYPTTTNNCWGVGGANLWDMGNNLGEGVVSMNKFLNNHPTRSKVKYSQMDFTVMNGLYKQPPGDHWVYNNQVIYDDLTDLERSL